jgi:hypothetical protein
MTGQADLDVNSFVAVLFLLVIGVTLLIMAGFWAFGRLAEHFGWFAEETQPRTPRLPVRRSLAARPRVLAPEGSSDLPVGLQAPEHAPTPPAAEPQAAAVLKPGEALPTPVWWHQIADSPVAVMIVGESQSGKTTTTRALLAWRARTDRIVIIDPHEKFNDWGALQDAVIGRDRNLEQAAAAFEALHIEFERRFRRGEGLGQGLTVFIDETPAIVAYAPEVAEYLIQWLLEGAKAGFRVVFLTQDPSVESLGIKGKGKVRLSTRKVLLGAFAADVPGVLNWPAAIEVTGSVKSIDASDLPAMALRAANIDPAVAWLTPTTLTTEPDAEPPELVRDGSNLRVLPPSDRTGSAGSSLVRADTDAVRGGSDGLSDDDLIAELVRRDVSGNKIHELLGGTRATVLEKVREIRSRVS